MCQNALSSLELRRYFSETRSQTMALLTPDPTFYPSPKMATEAPPERLGYCATLNVNGSPDQMTVVDLDP